MNNASIIVLAIAISTTAVLVTRFETSRNSSRSAAPASLSSTGQRAPDFALESLDGRTVHLSDFQGKAVLVNFWATWCLPCRIEMRWFEQMQNQYGPQGFQVLGIAMDDAKKKDIAEFARNLCVDYPILLGKESVGNSYGGVQVLPVTIYVGRDGKIVEKVFGSKGHDEIQDNVRKALSRR